MLACLPPSCPLAHALTSPPAQAALRSSNALHPPTRHKAEANRPTRFQPLPAPFLLLDGQLGIFSPLLDRGGFFLCIQECCTFIYLRLGGGQARSTTIPRSVPLLPIKYQRKKSQTQNRHCVYCKSQPECYGRHASPRLIKLDSQSPCSRTRPPHRPLRSDRPWCAAGTRPPRCAGSRCWCRHRLPSLLLRPSPRCTSRRCPAR